MGYSLNSTVSLINHTACILKPFNDEQCHRVLLPSLVAELEKAGPTATGDGGMRMPEMARLKKSLELI